MSQFELAVAAILFFLAILRVALISIVGLLVIRPVRDCPSCSRATILICKPWLTRLATPFEWR